MCYFCHLSKMRNSNKNSLDYVVSWNSTVGTEADFGLENPRIKFRCGRHFLYRPDGSDTHPASFKRTPEFLRAWIGSEVVMTNHFPFNAEIASGLEKYFYFSLLCVSFIFNVKPSVYFPCLLTLFSTSSYGLIWCVEKRNIIKCMISSLAYFLATACLRNYRALNNVAHSMCRNEVSFLPDDSHVTKK